jgi:2-polyprenyl-6-methoxyphenol hydroxylase-like FAD-dependent oxidoreductase
LARLAEQTGARTVWNARFDSIVFNQNGIATGVHYAVDHETVLLKSSVVVGADGPMSRVRKIIGSKTVTRKYIDSFLIGLIDSIESLMGRGQQYQGPGEMLGLMPEGNLATYMFYSVGERSFEQVKSQGLESLKKEIATVAPETESAMSNVAEWTKMAYFSPQNIQVEQWVGNGVALLGDSAHTFHPHAGQGVNMSLQDALVLADVIENGLKINDVSMNVLLQYQEKRKMFSDVISRHSHYTATYALSRNKFVQRLNKRALRKMQNNRKLLKEALTITAGLFEKKPGLIKELRIGGILP